jgi:hypothetical protein
MNPGLEYTKLIGRHAHVERQDRLATLNEVDPLYNLGKERT